MENVCRTCLRAPEELLPLYKDKTLVDKIETIASIQLSADDKYPSTICKECISNVNQLFNFRKVIINNDKELRERHATLERIKQLGMKTKNTQTDDIIITNDIQIKSEKEEMDEMKVFESINITMESASESEEDEEVAVNEKNNESSIKGILFYPKDYHCNICDKSFPSRFKLYNHKRTFHIAPGVCNVCGIVVRADNLKRHVQLHSEGPVQCLECGRVFKNSESLRGHTLIHKGEIFTCEICGKQSKVKSEHRRHVKTHTDPDSRKIMCTICGKKVRDLRKHQLTHTGERPHVCAHCGKGFTSPYALKVHTRQHTNERPYICEFCPMAFPQKVSLVTHLKSKHYQIKDDS